MSLPRLPVRLYAIKERWTQNQNSKLPASSMVQQVDEIVRRLPFQSMSPGKDNSDTRDTKDTKDTTRDISCNQFRTGESYQGPGHFG